MEQNISKTFHHPPGNVQYTARIVLFTFLLTFAFTRIFVLLIMTRRIQNLYLYVSGTHVHHLNHGIILLAVTGAYVLFANPTGRARTIAAVAYAIALALTFDEFGMWLHLGGHYWQRASYDAIVVIAALLGLLSIASRIRTMRLQLLIAIIAIAATVVPFAWLLHDSIRLEEQRMQTWLEHVEELSPR